MSDSSRDTGRTVFAHSIVAAPLRCAADVDVKRRVAEHPFVSLDRVLQSVLTWNADEAQTSRFLDGDRSLSSCGFGDKP